MQIRIDKNVPATMRDGIVLQSNVYRPDAAGPCPVLLTRTPYGKDMASSFVIDPVRMAEAGYIVVIQDVRGRFASQGQFGDNECELADGYDSVEWAAQLPGADGQVGMFGASYYAWTQWAAAISQPPALKAVVPLIAYADHWEGSAYRAGAFEWGLMGAWQMMMAVSDLTRRAATTPEFPVLFSGLFQDLDQLASEGYWELPIAEFAPLAKVGMNFLREHVDHDTYDSFWRQLSFRGRLRSVEIPTLHIGGWFDVFAQSTLNSFTEMQREGQTVRLLMGPWTHINQSAAVGDLVFGSGASLGLLGLRDDINSLHKKWFDWHLKDSDAPDIKAFAAEPAVRIFVMGDNRWRFSNTWPLPETEYTPLYLFGGGAANTRSGDGQLAWTPPTDAGGVHDQFVYDPGNPVPTTGGNLLLTPDFKTGPQEQSPVETRDDVLVYTSTPLSSDLEVTGPLTAHLWISSSAPDTDFVVRVCDVWPDGRSYNVVDGILRAKFRSSMTTPVPLTPGVVTEITVDLWSTSQVFKAGHQIRVVVTSSSFPRWSRNLNTGESSERTAAGVAAEQMVFHDAAHPSHILLPIIPR